MNNISAIKDVFRERINPIIEAHGGQTQFAKEADVARTSLSSWCSYTSKRLPDIESFIKICMAAGVSSDYLLGLSEEQSPDMNIRVACAFSGLSENAIIALKEESEINCKYRKGRIIKAEKKARVLNALLTSCAYPEIAEYMISAATLKADKLKPELIGTMTEEEIEAWFGDKNYDYEQLISDGYLYEIAKLMEAVIDEIAPTITKKDLNIYMRGVHGDEASIEFDI